MTEMQKLYLLAPLAPLAGALIAGLFMLLVLAFGRARDAVIVMVNLPLALIGGVVGVFLAVLFGLVERRVLRWYHGMREVERG